MNSSDLGLLDVLVPYRPGPRHLLPPDPADLCVGRRRLQDQGVELQDAEVPLYAERPYVVTISDAPDLRLPHSFRS